MISLVMSIYNGERFIIEQLQSIKNQTLKIDEVILVDDCSTDKTIEMVKHYIDDNQLTWKLYVNKKNLGWKANFYQGIQIASGDIIFLSDQDDIWELNKVEIMSNKMIDNPNIELLQSNYKIIYEDWPIQISTRIRYFLDNISHKRPRNSLKIKKRLFNNKLLYQQPGCVMAFRKSLFDKFKHMWDDTLGHDWLLTIFAICDDSYYEIDFSSIKWRRHCNNASTPRITNKNKRLDDLNDTLKILKIIQSLNNLKLISLNSKKINILERLIRITDKRIDLISKRKLLNWFYCFFFLNYYPRKREIITDLKYIKNRK